MFLGQHFLKNRHKLRKIAESLELAESDTIIEIGPGHGELTKKIITDFNRLGIKEFRIITIEKDFGLAKKINSKFSESEKIESITGDTLKILPELISDRKINTDNYKLVGNIPYYITGYLMRILGDLDKKPKLSVFTIQKEVGERIISKPPRMNLLSASIQVWAEVGIIASIPRNNFSPPPKVDSVVLKIKTKDKTSNDLGKIFGLIKGVFKQPRKTIINNLSDFSGMDKATIQKIIENLGIDPLDRPSNLGLSDIKSLSEKLKNRNCK